MRRNIPLVLPKILEVLKNIKKAKLEAFDGVGGGKDFRKRLCRLCL